ncbi:tetratricopeptide repeat protein, partial [Accumulibacter sp.]|uniref:tetratricopeptide repeat protein n=1 Tax=Accumulibacter sp. TaxID=2053492 RepID=UPI0025EC43A3
MAQDPKTPVRRRLDIKAMLPAGGGPEFLTVSLVDPGDHDHFDAQGVCTLPAPDLPLGDSGISVEEFLQHWRAGVPGLDGVARLYGQALHRQLLGNASPIHDAWQEATGAARQGAHGLRLEIRCPLDSASRWMGQPLSALPFELLCDERGYLFRRAGWSAVRRTRDLASRAMRLGAMANAPASVQVAWANVKQPGAQAMDDALFTGHDAAVQALDAQGVVKRLPPLPSASRRSLTDCLAGRRPHILVWVGHGLDSGSGLLLHDGDSPAYPSDPGRVVAASDFALTVRQGQVDVALLWSCHGAGTFRPLDVSVAEALLDPDRGDVAAVLASFAALDAAAVSKLSKDLIAAWGQAGSDLEAALARARAELDEGSLTWARPVLFLRTPPAAPGATLVPSLPPLLPITLGGHGLRWLPQLPACAGHYVDHQQRLERLTEDLDRHPVVVLEGLAGAGKTELALAMAYRRRAAGEGVAFIDLSGQPSLAHLRQTLGLLVAEQPFDDDSALLGALAGRKWLLVLDNAEDVLPDPAVRADLLRLLAGLRATGPGFRAIVTSRHALAAPGTNGAAGLFPRELTLLDPEESRILFIAAAGPRLAQHQAVPELLDPLLAELGGVARAIVLMAGQLGGEVDVPALRQQLAQIGPEAIAEPALHGVAVPAALDRHVHKARLASALRLSLASAVRQAPMAEALFDALGTLPGGLLQALLPQEERTALGDGLAALLDHHLVQLAGEQRRIMMAAPVRAWAWQRWQSAAALESRHLVEVVHEGLAAYASHLKKALGTPDAQAARLQFLTESSNLIQLLQLRTGPLWPAEDDPVAASVLRSASLFAQYGGTAHSMLPLLEPMAVSLFERAAETHSAALVMFSLAGMKMRTNDLAGARQAYEQALPIFRQIEARLGEANTLQALGDLKMRTDDLAGARQAYEQALPIYRQIEDRLGEANTLQALGDLKMRTNDLAGARQAYEQALPIFRQIEARLGEANTLRALGDLKMRTNDLAGARQAYEQALPIYRQIEARLGEANTLQALGDLKMRTDDLAGARQAYEQALPIFRQIEARLGEANTLRALGD